MTVLTHLWIGVNGLSFSIEKCSVVTSTRKAIQIAYQYNIQGTVMSLTSSIRPVVTFYRQITFLEHIHNRVAKALHLYGFII